MGALPGQSDLPILSGRRPGEANTGSVQLPRTHHAVREQDATVPTYRLPRSVPNFAPLHHCAGACIPSDRAQYDEGDHGAAARELELVEWLELVECAARYSLALRC